MNKFNVFLLAIMFVFAFGFTLAIPNGADTLTSVSNSTAAATSPEAASAIAGNVSEITL